MFLVEHSNRPFTMYATSLLQYMQMILLNVGTNVQKLEELVDKRVSEESLWRKENGFLPKDKKPQNLIFRLRSVAEVRTNPYRPYPTQPVHPLLHLWE